MNNSKTKSIILRSAAIFANLFALISLAFGAIFTQSSLGGNTFKSESTSYGDWFELVNNSNYDIWKASEAFLIISIIVLSLIVIGIVLQFFINNKALNLAIKILSIVGMLVVLLAFVLMLVGCIDNSSDFVQTIPAAGSWLFVIFGLVGSGLGIACGNKVKTSKRKRK